MIVVAFSMLALTGMAAIAIDASVGYNERRATQNAADNAALAGAWALCHGESALDAANASAAENGYPAEAVTIITPYDQAASVETTVDPDATVLVSIADSVGTTFGRTLGSSSLDVVSEAVATCSSNGGSGDVAIFAKGTTCAFTKSGVGSVSGLVYSGNNITLSGRKTFNGPVHADGRMTSSGSSITFNDNVSTVEGYVYSGHPTFNGGMPYTTAPWNLPYPVDYQVSDYQPGGPKAIAAEALGEYHYHDDDWNLSGSATIARGLHYVHGSVSVSGANKDFDHVTIVATGDISFSGRHEFFPYIDGLSLMSGVNRGCGSGISISGDSMFSGVVFAPNAGITISGTTVDGSIIGMSFSDSGNMDISANPDFLPAGDPELLLLE